MNEVFQQRVEDRLDSIEKILAVNTQVLKEHSRRSRASEGRLEQLEASTRTLEKDSYVRDRTMKFIAWAVPVVVAIISIGVKFI